MILNQILQWLSGGDLRSNGLSTEVADFVLNNPQMFDDLILGIHEPDDVTRAHTADALEKIAGSRPDLLKPLIGDLIDTERTEKVMAVKMHLADPNYPFPKGWIKSDHLQGI